MQKKRILFFSDCGPDANVFESQVLATALAWKNFGEVELWCRITKSEKNLPAHIQSLSLRYLKAGPNIAKHLWHQEAKKLKGLENFDIIHARGPVSAGLVLDYLETFFCEDKQYIKTKKQIIYDCRGAVLDELNYLSKDFLRRLFLPWRKRLFRNLEKKVMEKATIIHAVSDALSLYLEQSYGRKAECVTPCTTDFGKSAFDEIERKNIRQELNLNERDKLWIYVAGSVHTWQTPMLLKECWRALSELDCSRHLLVLSPFPETFLTLLNGSSNVRAIKVPHEKVQAYACAADAALLLRENTLTNRVACPVKLVEYLACGLKVLSNRPEYLKLAPPDFIALEDFYFSTPQLYTNLESYCPKERKERSLSMCEQHAPKLGIEKLICALEKKEKLAQELEYKQTLSSKLEKKDL